MNLETIAAQLAETIQKEANINAIFGEPKQLDEHTPEGLLGKVEHLIKGLRPGQKSVEAGH